jgi:hypothetical protein
MSRKHWMRILLVGLAYAVAGIWLSELSQRIATDHYRAWRLAAWLVSGVIFVLHFFFEQFRVKQRSLNVALHVALAVAVGAFILAGAASIHATLVKSHAPWWLFAIALVAWPALTGIPAFIVAILGSVLAVRLKLDRRL